MNRKLYGASSAAMLLALSAGAAHAQTAASTAPVAVAEVVVTGTRLTSGFQTPTPVTVLTAEQMAASAPNNLADATQHLPAFKGSANTTRRQGGSPNSSGGQNLLDLRGLGPQRNLVLLNGKRVVASNGSGSVDINLIPQDVVKNIEVLTGGASAAYGSDAVTGVVNFVLDTRFKGLKGSIQAGRSNYGDSEQEKGNISWGGDFMGGKLRVIASAEGMFGNGVDTFGAMNRKWWAQGGGIVTNPVTGAKPIQIIATNIYSASMTYGGLVTAGPLKGLEFGPGGTVLTHDFGQQSGIWQVGGTGIRVLPGLTPKQERYTGFLHAEYDVTDSLMVDIDANWGRSNNVLKSYPNYENGQFAFTIYNDNAFLPAEAKAKMAAANVSTITVGRHSRDIPLEEIDAVQEMKRVNIGFEKRFENNWKLDGSYTRGVSRQDTDANDMTINRNLYAASDAVKNPSTGQIVCRSQYYTGNTFVAGGTGLDPGCVPLNIFGDGSITPEMAKYILGSSIRNLDLTQDVAQLNISGDLPEQFSLPAGVMSLATGVEYRKETSKQWSDAISQSTPNNFGLRANVLPTSLNNRAGGLQTFNAVPFAGQYSVREAYVELGVPVLKDMPLVQELTLNIAGRAADYSNSGLVKSWKLGGSWKLNEDIRFRLTKSRDIRGPNILELFNPRSTNSANVLYKGVTTGYTGFSTGNPDLKPESATTTTGGVVLTPHFIPGLDISVDAYKIDLQAAIAQLGGQGIVDQCNLGSTVNCALIQLVSGGPPAGSLIITNPFQNLNQQIVQGFDYEAAYRFPLYHGTMNIRALANYTQKDETQTPGGIPTDNAGDIHASDPKWQANIQATYTQGPLSLFVMERYVGGGNYNNLYVEGVDINNNSIPAYYYTDANAKYDFSAWGHNFTWFLSIQNVFDKDPPVVPLPSTFQQPTNASLYDTIGRYSTTGLRFRF